MWNLEESRTAKAAVVLCAGGVAAFCGWLLLVWAPSLTVSPDDRTVGSALGSEDESASQSPAESSPGETPAARVVVLGDSFTTGTADGWPEQVCQTGRCEYDGRFAEAGSGFVARGEGGTRFGERVDAVVAAAPDVVIVAGGAHDKGVPARLFQRRVSDVLDRLKAGLPQSRIVVLSPFWRSTPLPAEVQTMREVIGATAAAEELDFVDVADILGPAGGDLVAEDGLPTAAGHARIATAVQQAVQDNIAQAEGYPGA